MASRACVLLVLVACSASAECDRRAPSAAAPDATSPLPPAPVGRCENVAVHGTCTFRDVLPIDPATGAPLPPDAKPGPDGTVVYAIEYALPGGGSESASARVRATQGDRATLERFYAAHAQASCDGEIVRPPCAPGVLVTVQIASPPVGAAVPR